MFSEARNANLSGRPDGYKELKKLLIATFDMNEMERVRRLTETVQLGNRIPGDVLREMQQLAVTTDERVLKNLWLQRLPPELGAALSTSRDLPIATLRHMANTIHGFMPGQSVAQISVPAPVRNQHTSTQPPTCPIPQIPCRDCLRRIAHQSPRMAQSDSPQTWVYEDHMSTLSSTQMYRNP